jgi:hypothetical protein
MSLEPGLLFVTHDLSKFFIMAALEDRVFPNKALFPDINNLFNDMSLSGDNKNNIGFRSRFSSCCY